MKLKQIAITLLALSGTMALSAQGKAEDGKKKSTTKPKNIITIEAESTKSDLGKWIKITPKDSNYVKDASGTTHLEFTSNTVNGGAANSPLDYVFKVPTTGTYRLLIRCSKRLDGQPGDKCNDGYVALNGNFESGNDIPTADLKKNEKFFGGAASAWGWAETLDYQGHIKKPAIYKLKAGESYTLTVSGRSIRWNIDKIILFDTLETNIAAVKTFIDPKQQVALNEKWNLKVDGYVPAYYDGGNKAYAINTIAQPTDKWAAATQVFEKPSGTYAVKFTSLTELDGECSYKVKLDGKEIINYTNPRIHGTNQKDYTPHIVTVKDVTIKKGATIMVEFISNSNKLVPEKDAFGYARARWQEIEFTKM